MISEWKSKIQSLVIYEKESDYRAGWGMTCKHESFYEISEEDKEWLIETLDLARMNRDLDYSVFYHYPPSTEELQGMMFYAHPFMLIIFLNKSEFDKRKDGKKLEKDLLSMIQGAKDRGLEHSEFSKLTQFYDCEKCKTELTCFPHFLINKGGIELAIE